MDTETLITKPLDEYNNYLDELDESGETDKYLKNLLDCLNKAYVKKYEESQKLDIIIGDYVDKIAKLDEIVNSKNNNSDDESSDEEGEEEEENQKTKAKTKAKTIKKETKESSKSKKTKEAKEEKEEKEETEKKTKAKSKK
jgi:hypothetical protein